MRGITNTFHATTDLWHYYTVEVTVQSSLLGKHIVGRCGKEDAKSPSQRGMGAVRKGEIVFTQERIEGGRLTREELQGHRSSWQEWSKMKWVEYHNIASAYWKQLSSLMESECCPSLTLWTNITSPLGRLCFTAKTPVAATLSQRMYSSTSSQQ